MVEKIGASIGKTCGGFGFLTRINESEECSYCGGAGGVGDDSSIKTENPSLHLK